MNDEQTTDITHATAAEAVQPHVTTTEAKRSGKPSFWQTRYGLLLANDSKATMARSLAEYGEWIEQELDTLGALLDEGHVALEYGAEYGAQTLWLSQLVGAHGQVHVVEPRRLEHIALCSTLAINQVSNVYPLHAALGDNRHATVFLAATDDQPEETCRQMALDAVRMSKLHLIKVNRPGGLLPMLAGAESTLRQHRPSIYFRLSNTDLATEEINTLKSLGYRCWSHLPYLYSARNFAGSTSNIFPGWVSQNVIASHRESAQEFVHLNEL